MSRPPTALPAVRRQQWLQRVDSALRTQGVEVAGRLAVEAIADGVDHPAVLNLAATARYGERRYEEAAQLLKRARSLSPRDANILNSLGVCLKALGQTNAALQTYEAALRVDPNLPQAHFNRGAVLEEYNDIGRARTAFERAAALNPNYPEPLASLAFMDAQAGDMASSRRRAQRALQLAPSNVLARMALGWSDLQEGDLPSAGVRLAELLSDPGLSTTNRSIVLGLIGDLHDAEGRPAEAFASYAASNAELRRLNQAQFDVPGKETALAQARRLSAWFEEAESEPWQHASPARPRAADSKKHVFLVGFPRSGTTLLENVLATHPDVVSLEEKDCLEELSHKYVASADGLERLARISDADAMRDRQAYWSRVRAFGVEPRGKLFIDKMPLNSVLLPVVAKLFPTARVLFALRDPRDVVLSCFRRRFGMNASMYQLLTLDGATAFYDAVMRLSEAYRELLPLSQHQVRYEALVDNLEGTSRAACAFLGLKWDENMLDFAARARTRDIGTPSAAQVVRGLNREGQGTWRRYREQLAPVLPLLEPWVERFGYASE